MFNVNDGVISINDFTRENLEHVLNTTDEIMRMNPTRRRRLCQRNVMGYLFYEPSTRTRLSFNAAMASLGGTSIGISDITSSSAQKGESLEDTVKIMSNYSDVLVIRHPLDGSGRLASEVSDKPVINAGSGTEEHPTQAIQDLFTIRKEKEKIDGLQIGIIGDLKYGRTVYSLLYALANYDVNIHLISPESLKVRPDSVCGVKTKVGYTETTTMDEFIDELDVLYVTRIQKERFSDEEEYLKVKNSYVIDMDTLDKMKKDAIIMHPLPRVDEISKEVDSMPNAKYFKQAEYGKYVRATLLDLVLNKK